MPLHQELLLLEMARRVLAFARVHHLLTGANVDLGITASQASQAFAVLLNHEVVAEACLRHLTLPRAFKVLVQNVLHHELLIFL